MLSAPPKKILLTIEDLLNMQQGQKYVILMQPILGMSHVITLWLILLEKYEKLFLLIWPSPPTIVLLFFTLDKTFSNLSKIHNHHLHTDLW